MQQSTEDMASYQVTEPEIMDMDKYLSSANAPDIEEDARLCIASGAREMILNCASLAYVTGAGLRAFLNISRMMQMAGGRVAVMNLAGQPLEMYHACGLEGFVPVVSGISRSSQIQAA